MGSELLISGTAAATSSQGGVAAAGASATAPPLSLSMSHNSNEDEPPQVNRLTGSQRRMAHVLSLEIVEMARRFGLEKLGFLTLTFSDQVTAMDDAQRRFNSLNTGILRARYSRSIGVWERQKSGRLHVHLVVAAAHDIRTGVDFEAIQRRDYRSAGPHLRAEWAFWRRTAPKYRFGRTELLPVRTTGEGIARYVGGYIRKGIEGKLPEDSGRRVVRFIGYHRGDRRASAQFAWNTDNGWLWRQKLGKFAASVGARDTGDLARLFGARWAFNLQAAILSIPITGEHPSERSARADSEICGRMWAVEMAGDLARRRQSQPGRAYQLKRREQ